MRVLFVSGELIAGDVAYRLSLEGCEVKLYIEDKSRKDCFENMVQKTDNWRNELGWVGKDGLVVFDDIIFGKAPDQLRHDGYTVFGGGEKGDILEQDREFAQKFFSSCGMTIQESKDFSEPEMAIRHIEDNPCRWVVKQNAHDGSLSYVGCMDDGSDAISMIRSYQQYNKSEAIKTISLQKRIDGVEVAVARFFNGKDWNSPIFISFEHKPFLNEDIGPLTAEMGTLAWYDENENNKLFQATLARIKPYLQSIDYRGYVDINSIVNGQTLFPLEATMRFGSPTNQLQSSMHRSLWHNLLYSTAKGEKSTFQFKKGFSVVISIAIPPFPYKIASSDYYLKNVDIFFKEKLSPDEWARVHFEEVSKRKNSDQLYISGSNGYILFIAGSGETVETARLNAYNLVKKIIIPKMMYRTDIGIKFVERDEKLLKDWGWI